MYEPQSYRSKLKHHVLLVFRTKSTSSSVIHQTKLLIHRYTSTLKQRYHWLNGPNWSDGPLKSPVTSTTQGWSIFNGKIYGQINSLVRQNTEQVWPVTLVNLICLVTLNFNKTRQRSMYHTSMCWKSVMPIFGKDDAVIVTSFLPSTRFVVKHSWKFLNKIICNLHFSLSRFYKIQLPAILTV